MYDWIIHRKPEEINNNGNTTEIKREILKERERQTSRKTNRILKKWMNGNWEKRRKKTKIYIKQSNEILKCINKQDYVK